MEVINVIDMSILSISKYHVPVSMFQAAAKELSDDIDSEQAGLFENLFLFGCPNWPLTFHVISIL